MKNLTILFITLISLFSCNETAQNNENERTAALEKEAEAKFEKFGKEITEENAIESSDLMTQL
ncbi:MAG: hypothetical protein ACPG4Y_11015, partial [Chitinophagales bacterium]